jgi:ABC-type Fe3+/spermidine/putrescine transport system ATPase subunit
MITLNNYKFDKYKNYYFEVDRLEINQGERIFIVGPSGSGKTTLLRALCALEDKSYGELNIDGISIKGFNDKNLQNMSLMLLTQELGLWTHMSAQEHISFAITKGKSIKEDASLWLELVGLKHKQESKPHELSGGERQRLALARALCTKPKYLFLDEPFANIDSVLAYELLEMINLQQGIQEFTLIKTTHHYLGLKDSKTIILVVNNGKIIQKGTWMEIKNNPQDEWTKKWVELLS